MGPQASKASANAIHETSPLLPKSPLSGSRSPSPLASVTSGSYVEIPSSKTWHTHIALFTALANCLFAGSVLIYSLWAPLFQRNLHYSQMQVNAISAAAEIGMYLPVPIFGYICDRYGPSNLSALAAFFFAPGYAWAALAYAGGWRFEAMVGAFAMVGMGTSSMYFSGVTTCAKTFTGRRGLALAAPIAAFGLSSLWMTQVVSRVFIDENGELAVDRAFWFFSGTLMFVGLLGSIGLRGGTGKEQGLGDETVVEGDNRWINADTRAFLKDRTMWGFAAGVFLVTGPGEAFINNMGTLIVTLRPSTSTSSSPVDPAVHVSLIALTSTLARLFAGAVSDYLAPPMPTSLLPPVPAPIKRYSVSRMYILFAFSLLMFTGFYLVSSSFVYAHPTLFALVSSSIGAGYGAAFCLAPTVVSVVWGTRNFGTNWGIVTMTPALGAVVYGSLFAAEYDGHATGADGTCVGAHCSRWSFGAMAASVAVAILSWTWVWRGSGGWRQRGVIV